MGKYKKLNQNRKIYSVYSNNNNINKDDIMSHWVGHSKLKDLYINGFFERKDIIEDLEAELNGAIKETSNTDNLVVDEDSNIDEAITAESKASNEMETVFKMNKILNLINI